MVASCALACNSNARRYDFGFVSCEWAMRNADSAATSAHRSEIASMLMMASRFHDFCTAQTLSEWLPLDRGLNMALCASHALGCNLHNSSCNWTNYVFDVAPAS